MMRCTDSAIDLLMKGDEDREPPFLNTIWSPLLGVFFGTVTAAGLNYGSRRPIFSGIQKYPIAIAGWIAICMMLEKRKEYKMIEKEAALRDYVRLHPEDFPIPPRKKIADIFEPWNPVR